MRFLVTFSLLNTASLVLVYSQETSIVLQEEIESLASGGFLIGSEEVFKSELVVSFYRSVNYQLAWSDMRDVAMLLALLQRATDEGLTPQDYHFVSLHRYYAQDNLTDYDKIFFDILLTDAFMFYSSHLLNGKVNPVSLYPDEWIPTKRKANLVASLQLALEENGLAKLIDALRPQNPGYEKLKQALQFYRNAKQKEIWPLVPKGKPIESGMKDARIPLIRKRLLATDDLSVYCVMDSTYDSVLVKKVKRFQRQNGLTDDGIIGKYTVDLFNQSADFYIQKISANLERYRWLPDSLGEHFMTINIPDFVLTVFEHDSCVKRMKVIVGRPDRKTPIFSSDIHYLILNPTWTVPPTILREDVLPAVKQNIRYLENNSIRVFNRKGEEIDPTGLPWESYTEKNFPYQLRQDSGPNNSLGLIKFYLSNSFRVFLHDTNHHGLFLQHYRALSSGCIRIEHPFWLAQYLLKETSWTKKKINKVIESGKTTTVVFPQPALVHLQYFTAFVNDEGELQLRNDIYSWDECLMDALSGRPYR